jgi:hypothetical protein
MKRPLGTGERFALILVIAIVVGLSARLVYGALGVR